MTGTFLRSVGIVQVFVIGGVVMGYEMVVSRFLYPHFGSGINTWAVLISTVLLSLAIGYFAGGMIVRRIHPPLFSAFATVVAGLYLIALSRTAPAGLTAASEWLGDGFAGLLAGSLYISFLPVALLGSLSPAFVAMFARDIVHVGRVAGWIYAVSAIGNVSGILATTYLFIPNWGSRAITLGFGVTLLASGALFWFLSRARRDG